MVVAEVAVFVCGHARVARTLGVVVIVAGVYAGVVAVGVVQAVVVTAVGVLDAVVVGTTT